MGQFATFVKNDMVYASKKEAQNLTHIGYGNYKKVDGAGPTFVWDKAKNDFVVKSKEHSKLVPTAIKSPLGWRAFVEIHDPKFLYTKPTTGKSNFLTRDDAISHAKKHIESVMAGGTLGESEDIRHSKAQAMGLKHIAYKIYKNSKGDAYEWNEKKNDFDKLEDKHPHDLTKKSKSQAIKDALDFVNKHPGEWHSVSKDKQTRDAVKTLEKEGHIELKVVNPGATHEMWMFKSKKQEENK